MCFFVRVFVCLVLLTSLTGERSNRSNLEETTSSRFVIEFLCNSHSLIASITKNLIIVKTTWKYTVFLWNPVIYWLQVLHKMLLQNSWKESRTFLFLSQSGNERIIVISIMWQTLCVYIIAPGLESLTFQNVEPNNQITQRCLHVRFHWSIV